MPSRKFLVNLTLVNAVVVMTLVLAVPSPFRNTDAPPTRRARLLDAALADARSPDRLERLTALRVLGALGDAKATAVLQEMRRSDDVATATEAAHALARI